MSCRAVSQIRNGTWPKLVSINLLSDTEDEGAANWDLNNRKIHSRGGTVAVSRSFRIMSSTIMIHTICERCIE